MESLNQVVFQNAVFLMNNQHMKCRNLRMLELTSHCKIKDDFLDNNLYTYQNGSLDEG